MQISFCATILAQKDISSSTQDNSEHQFIFKLDGTIGFQSGLLFFNNSQGVLLDYKMTSKWLIGTGFRLAAIRDRFNATLTGGILDDNGFLVASLRVVPKSASYIQIPLSISHRSNRLQFGFELSNNFLLGVRGTSFIFDPLSSIVEPVDNATKKIESTGFRKYHLRGHLFGLLHFDNGFGFGVEIFQPITDIAVSPDEIPSGNPLFVFKDNPGGVAFHLFYEIEFN